MNLWENFTDLFNPPVNPDLEPLFSHQKQHLPTLWLLGKTGAGKSSLIHAITGDDQVQIGNGFQSCTSESCSYDFPQDKPLFRFLDTRGLAEANYDPDKDIAACQGRSHALIIVARAEDPEQSSVLDALRKIKKTSRIKHLLLVHTGIELIADSNERQQCIAHNQEQFEKAWGEKVDAVAVDFELVGGGATGVDELKSQLAEFVPVLALVSDREEHVNAEENNFAHLKREVLWYCGAAGASDAVPGVGLVSVPVIQGKMLHSLAGQYGVEWNKKLMSEFVGALGAGFGIQYASRLGIRQLVKFIPLYGQTVGSVTAVTISFCSTYAIGRVACKYLYHKKRGEAVPEDEMKAMYKKALDEIKKFAKNEAND